MKKFSLFVFAFLLTFITSCLKDDLQDFPIEKDVWKRGLIIDTTAYNNTPHAQPPIMKPLPLPDSYDLTNVMPPIDEYGQNPQASCVAWAIGYCVRSYIEKTKQGYSYGTDKDRVFSPQYIYSQIKISDCDKGSNYKEGFDLLVTQGVCTWQQMPYDADHCSVVPNLAQKQKAASYKINSYKRVAFDLEEIKTFIYNDKPVLIAVSVNDNLKDAPKVNGEFIWVKDNSTSYSGLGAAMVIIGYDQNRQLFKLFNSWGTGWGNKGYAWVTFDKLLSCIQEAYVID